MSFFPLTFFRIVLFSCFLRGRLPLNNPVVIKLSLQRALLGLYPPQNPRCSFLCCHKETQPKKRLFFVRTCVYVWFSVTFHVQPAELALSGLRQASAECYMFLKTKCSLTVLLLVCFFYLFSFCIVLYFLCYFLSALTFFWISLRGDKSCCARFIYFFN